MPVIILGLLHLYIGVRLLPDLASSPGLRVGGALLLVVSCVLMLAGLMSRSMQSRTVADRVAALGLLAMSLFSSLFVFTLLRDLVLLVAIVALPVRHVHLLMAATATAKALIPIARPNMRWGYVKRTNAEFTLMIPAAPRPCTTRAMLRVPRVGARAHASEAAVNIPVPQSDTRR